MFSGGFGKGDVSLRLSSSLMSDNFLFNGGFGRGDVAFLLQNSLTGDQALFLGGTGRGDIGFLLSASILGTDFMFQGGNGRGDIMGDLNQNLLGDPMFSGGSGRGDFSFRLSNVLTGDDFLFSGGFGRGDVALLNSNMILGDDFMYQGGLGRGDRVAEALAQLTDQFMFFGGEGRGDVAFLSQPTLLGTDLIYTGGFGKGDVAALLAARVLSGRILWRGGGSPGQETAWNQSTNWYPQSVPGPNDEIAIENNANGRNLLLDQNRRIRALDFNNSGKKLVLGNFRLSISDSITGGDSLNYIITNGTGCASVLHPVSGSRFYPVGRSAYNPVQIVNHTSAADSFCVCVYDEVRANGLSGPVLGRDPRVRRTWDIEKGSGESGTGNGVDFTFWWNAGEDTLNPVSLFLSHHDGLVWTQQPGTALVNGRSLTYSGYMGSFSPFAINGNQPLPVSWLYVNGVCVEGVSRLSWATATEANNRRFVVEGSTDGSRWQDLTEIPGSGNSSSIMTYSAEINTENIYFRIRQEDFDGLSDHSEWIYLPCKGSVTEVAVVPNPSEGIFRILGSEQLNAYAVFNALGQKVQEGLLHGLPDWKLDLSSMDKGIYSLRLLGEGKDILSKLVIQ